MASAYGTSNNNVKLQTEETNKYEIKSILGFSRNNKYEAALLVLSFIFMIIFNILSNAICGIGEKPICKNNAQQSDTNPTYLTPDGLTFSIWGIIYLFELFFTVYQAIPVARGGGYELSVFDNVRPYVIFAFILNGLWLIIFSFSLWWLSQLVIVAYLYCIVKAYQHLQVDWFSQIDTDGNVVGIKRKLFTYAPFGFQAAWLVVATTLNVGVVGYNNGWTPPPDFGVMIIAVVMVINVYLQLTRADVCYAFVSCWALAGIVRQQTNPQKLWPVDKMPPSIEIIHWANFAIAFIIGTSVVGLIRAFLNRNTPHKMAPYGVIGGMREPLV